MTQMANNFGNSWSRIMKKNKDGRELIKQRYWYAPISPLTNQPIGYFKYLDLLKIHFIWMKPIKYWVSIMVVNGVFENPLKSSYGGIMVSWPQLCMRGSTLAILDKFLTSSGTIIVVLCSFHKLYFYNILNFIYY